MIILFCDQCGENYTIINGVSNHVDADGDIDHDADADHVPYGEEQNLEVSK